MPRAPFVVTAVLLLAALGRAADLLLDPDPFAAGPAAVLAASTAAGSLIAATGILVARGRWARNAGLVIAGGSLALGAVLPLDPISGVVLAAAGAALAGLAGPWLVRGWLRRLPSADGPPSAAVALVLGLLAFPALIALSRPSGLGALDWALVAATPVLGWALGRGSTAALWLIRLVLPATAIAAGISAGLPGGPVIALAGVAAGVTAWAGAVSRAVSPLIPERVPAVPFPPELVPGDILRAAGFDQRGRRLGEEERR
jgi:hypothetical protein